MEILELINKGSKKLKNKLVKSNKLDSEILLSKVLNKTREELLINLDKWNKKQLKSMEITGNKFAREAFAELGIQKISGIYDYESSSLQKYKDELANKVKELLEIDDIKNGESTVTINNSNNSSNKNRNGSIFF